MFNGCPVEKSFIKLMLEIKLISIFLLIFNDWMIDFAVPTDRYNNTLQIESKYCIYNYPSLPQLKDPFIAEINVDR